MSKYCFNPTPKKSRFFLILPQMGEGGWFHDALTIFSFCSTFLILSLPYLVRRKVIALTKFTNGRQNNMSNTGRGCVCVLQTTIFTCINISNFKCLQVKVHIDHYKVSLQFSTGPYNEASLGNRLALQLIRNWSLPSRIPPRFPPHPKTRQSRKRLH